MRTGNSLDAAAGIALGLFLGAIMWIAFGFAVAKWMIK